MPVRTVAKTKERPQVNTALSSASAQPPTTHAQAKTRRHNRSLPGTPRHNSAARQTGTHHIAITSRRHCRTSQRTTRPLSATLRHTSLHLSATYRFVTRQLRTQHDAPRRHHHSPRIAPHLGVITYQVSAPDRATPASLRAIAQRSTPRRRFTAGHYSASLRFKPRHASPEQLSPSHRGASRHRKTLRSSASKPSLRAEL